MFGGELVVGLLGSGTPPSNLNASQLAYEQVRLTWTNNEPTQQTRIYRQIANGSFDLMETVAAGVALWDDATVEAGQDLTYFVRHYDGTRMTNPSNSDSISLPVAEPTGLTGDVVGGEPYLEWTNGDNNADTVIFRDGVDYDQVGPGVNSYTDVGASGSFLYWVRHTRNGAESGVSNSVNVDTGTGGPSAAPSSLVAAAAGSSQIDLSWSNGDSSANTVIERSPNGSSGWTEIDTVSPGETSASDTTVSPGTTYYYRVYHTKNGFDSGYSNTDSDTTSALPVLSSVSAANHASGNCTTTYLTNRVSYTVSGDTTGYSLEISVSIDGAPEILVDSRSPASGTSYHVLFGERLDNAFGDFRTYSYSVRLYAGSQDATGSPSTGHDVGIGVETCP